MRSLAFTVFPALFLQAFLMSCSQPHSHDPRQELLETINDQRVSGFYYTTYESESQSAASFIKPPGDGFITPNPRDTSILLGYTRVKDNASQTAELYSSGLIRKDSAWSLIVTNVTTGKPHFELDFPLELPPLPEAPAPVYESLQACIDDFNCKHQCALQQEANRTCKTQQAAIICCLNNGTCFSVHLIFPPTSWHCTILDRVNANWEGLVLAR